MNTKIKIFSLSFLFLTSCTYDETHTYLDNHDNFIEINLSDSKKDKFILRNDHLDFDGESVEIEYRGDFNKDSVDAAVKKYLKTGELPLKHQLH